MASLTKCGTQECINVMEDYKIGRLDTNGIDYNSVGVPWSDFAGTVLKLISNPTILFCLFHFMLPNPLLQIE